MVTNSKQAPKSTMEQIIEKLLKNLADKPEFDKETMTNLTEIANKGELRTSTKVEKVIKGIREDRK